MGIFHRTRKSHGRAGHTTVVAPGTVIAGDLRSEGGVHIDGTVDGNVHAKEYVIVAEGASVAGELHAREVYLGGRVEGDIWAVEVEILEGGRCEGTVEAMRIHKEKKE